MGRITGPVCRLCRRDGLKLFLKGTRCDTSKCAFERRSSPPGMVQKRRGKPTEYGIHLREKQKVKHYYGVLERQFRKTFEEAAHLKGITGENLMSLLERRLDNVVHRMGFGTSRPQARQIVRHGHVQVNGRKVNIPSFVVRPNDVVEIRDKSKKNPTILAARDATAHSPAPNWLEVDRDALKARVLGNPQRADLVQIQVNDQMIVELYSK